MDLENWRARHTNIGRKKKCGEHSRGEEEEVVFCWKHRLGRGETKGKRESPEEKKPEGGNSGEGKRETD